MTSLMGINLDSNLGFVSQTMGALTQLQHETASNIANANTPGYQAKHSEFANLMGVGNSPMETSLSAKMGSSPASGLLAQQGGGGPVSVQDEFMRMQKNLLFYTVATRRLSTMITNLKASGNIGR